MANVTRIPAAEREHYKWPLNVRAAWCKSGTFGYGDIVKVNRKTLELTDGKYGGQNMLVSKSLIFELITFDEQVTTQ